MDNTYRRGGLVGPILIIGVGTVLLLNTLGYLPYSIWPVLLRLWPVVLIAIGIDLLIGRRSLAGRLLALVLILALIGGGLWLAGVRLGPAVAPLGQGERVEQALGNAQRANIRLEPVLGELTLTALPDGSANLIEGTIYQLRGERVERTTSFEGGTMVYGLAFSGPTGWIGYDAQNALTWKLALTSRIPMTLQTQMVVGQSILDLGAVQVEDLSAETVVGQTALTLPTRGQYRAKVSGVVGETTILVPKGLGVKLRAGRLLSGIQLPAGYVSDGDSYLSPGYAAAADRVDLQVDQVLGSITIR